MEVTWVDYRQAADDYERVAQAIRYISENRRQQPGLEELASYMHISPFHLQRLFTRWVGISPKRFLQFLTKEHAKAILAGSGDVLTAEYESGLSGPGRLHDLIVASEALTPGEYKLRGAGLTIYYGIQPSPFGESLLAFTGRGVAHLAFVEPGEEAAALADLRKRWPRASLVEEREGARERMRQVFQAYSQQVGSNPAKPSGSQLTENPLRLQLQGTNFQMQVWQALLRVPPGSLVTYADLAVYIGLPQAARAVGGAVSANPLPVLIPCHRVIRKEGMIGDYRYGTVRKQAILGWEFAVREVN